MGMDCCGCLSHFTHAEMVILVKSSDSGSVLGSSLFSKDKFYGLDAPTLWTVPSGSWNFPACDVFVT